MGEPKTRTGDQSHYHQGVFDVIARLQCVVPEVEYLRNMTAKTNQHKQKSTELKKVSPHFTRGCCMQARREESARSIPTILLLRV